MYHNRLHWVRPRAATRARFGAIFEFLTLFSKRNFRLERNNFKSLVIYKTRCVSQIDTHW